MASWGLSDDFEEARRQLARIAGADIYTGVPNPRNVDDVLNSRFTATPDRYDALEEIARGREAEKAKEKAKENAVSTLAKADRTRGGNAYVPPEPGTIMVGDPALDLGLDALAPIEEPPYGEMVDYGTGRQAGLTNPDRDAFVARYSPIEQQPVRPGMDTGTFLTQPILPPESNLDTPVKQNPANIGDAGFGATSKGPGVGLGDEAAEPERQLNWAQSLAAKWFGIDTDDKRDALSRALITGGLATMAGDSPYAMQNIGKGGLAGVDAWADVKGEQADAAKEEFDRMMELQRFELSREAHARAERGESTAKIKDRIAMIDAAVDLMEQGIDPASAGIDLEDLGIDPKHIMALAGRRDKPDFAGSYADYETNIREMMDTYSMTREEAKARLDGFLQEEAERKSKSSGLADLLALQPQG